MKRLTVIALLLTLALLIAACGSPNDNTTTTSNTTDEQKPTEESNAVPPSEGFTAYEDALNGLSLTYPDNWTLDDSTGQIRISSHAIIIQEGTPPEDPFGFVTMSIVGRGMAGLSENPSSDDMVNYLEGELPNLGVSATDLKQVPTALDVNGRNGAVAVIEQVQGELILSTYLVTFFESDRILLSFSFSNDLPAFQDTFEAINNSTVLSEPDLSLVDGVEQYPDQLREHQEGLTYPEADQLPPVGGIHDPVWQNCGYYPDPIETRNALHSMEHGAVWITYQPDLPAGDIEQIAQLASGNTHVLISPYPGLQSPIVLTAWSVQLEIDSLDDERISAFINTYQQGPQTPEPGALCLGGIGSPE